LTAIAKSAANISAFREISVSSVAQSISCIYSSQMKLMLQKHVGRLMSRIIEQPFIIVIFPIRAIMFYSQKK
jgi:hypothetical protein